MIAYLEANGPRQGQWRDALLPVTATLQAAVRSLTMSGLQIALVVDDAGRLAGTLTDGDIRRALLRGVALDAPVTEAHQAEPLVVPPQLGRRLVLAMMRANRIRHLPVVDAEHRIVGLHLWDDVAGTGGAERANTMVIMAGGRGTRLMPHTEHCPKPLVPVNGRPMLEHIIERAHGEGFRRFVLAIHHLGHMIEGHFGDGSRFGVEIAYLREERPLGTAGALSLLDTPDAPFLVTNGDVLTDVRYAELLEFHQRHGAVATMAVRQHEYVNPFGVVRTRGITLVGFEEKPVVRTHINAGIYCLDPVALAALPPGEPCDMPMLFARLIERGEPTIAFPMHEPWLDVGRADDLARAQVLRPTPLPESAP
ncbi:MAG: nucleotidyltransferase family protein [Gemmatimonadaceae bacterium]|jgi:dTDP-glucose pyrophosphorylase|nr:nucleotidyltransferase family protein [Gemmatimonadaceae bacterium]